MLVSRDKYELPIIVADSCRELASALGIKPGTIHASLSRAKRLNVWTGYRRVPLISDAEEEEIFGKGDM